MTAVCSGGGPSQAKPGFARDVYVSTAGLGALLNNVPVAWAVPLAAYLASKTYDMTTFCTNDPASDPGFTAADAVNLLNVFNPFVNAPAIAKLQQLVDRFAWYQFCQCVSGTQPTPPSPPSAPTGLPLVNPPVVPPVSGPGCFQRSLVGVITPGFTNVYEYGDFAGTSNVFPFPITYVRISGTVQNDVAGSSTTYIAIQFYLSGGGSVGARSLFGPFAPGASFDVNVPYVSPATNVEVQVVWSSGSGANHVNLTETLYCDAGGPNAFATACCPPDPTQTGMLERILGLVTLLQRNTAPFAYVLGASHSGLSGNGTLTVPSLLGLHLTLTTVPGPIGTELGSPNEIFEAGWFSWGTADGFLAREFISHNPQLSFPPLGPQYTRIGYSLAPGVVATLQEIYAES